MAGNTVLKPEDREYLLKHLRTVKDFPQPGINFKDVTTQFKDPKCLQIITDALYNLFKDKGITKVVGIESRWFVWGGALAYKLWAWFVPLRKPWKLPADTISAEYEKEYGKDRVEMHKDAITSDDIVLVHDDLLATWGTMGAAVELLRQCNVEKIYVCFIIDIPSEKLKWKEYLEEKIGIPKENIINLLDC